MFYIVWAILIIAILIFAWWVWPRKKFEPTNSTTMTDHWIRPLEEAEAISTAPYATEKARAELDEPDTSVSHEEVADALEKELAETTFDTPEVKVSNETETPLADAVVADKKKKRVASKAPHARFNATEIRAIRRSSLSNEELAKKHGVSKSAISAIKRRESYRNVR